MMKIMNQLHFKYKIILKQKKKGYNKDKMVNIIFIDLENIIMA